MKTQKTVTFYRGIEIEYCYVLKWDSKGLYRYKFSIDDNEYSAMDIEDAQQQIDLKLDK